MFSTRTASRFSSFLVTAIPLAGVMEEHQPGAVEEQMPGVEEQKAVGVFAIYRPVTLTTSLELKR